jgi:hypothetical protein
MSFGDKAILWLHIAAAVFTIGPGTAAIMSTPRYIRNRNPAIVGFLLRTTRIYAFGTLLVLVFGLILTGMTHKFSQWWVTASLTLFVVAFALLLIIMRDQRKALAVLDVAEGASVADAMEASVADAMEDSARREAAGEADGPGGQSAATATTAKRAAATTEVRAAVERGRIASLGGLTALIWLVILVFMVWH